MENKPLDARALDFYARLEKQIGKQGAELADHFLGLETKLKKAELSMIDESKARSLLKNTQESITFFREQGEAIAYIQVWHDVANNLINRKDKVALYFSEIVNALNTNTFGHVRRMYNENPIKAAEGFPDEEYTQAVSDFVSDMDSLNQENIDEICSAERLTSFWAPMRSYYAMYVRNMLDRYKDKKEFHKAVAIGTLLMAAIGTAEKYKGFALLKVQLAR